MKAEIITIGDEILRGEILDSNKGFLSERLLDLGLETHWQTSVRDDLDAMIDAFERAAKRSDVVLISGGLGPTRDDCTTEAIAKAFGRKLVLDQASLEAMRGFFARLGREMAESNRKQAYFPEGAEVLPNPIGTAPGFCLQEACTSFFCMPGVPVELKLMMDQCVLPWLVRAGFGEGTSKARLLRTFGMGESSLEDALKDVLKEEGVSLGFRTSFPDNLLRPVAHAACPEEAEAKLARACKAIQECLGPIVYGGEEEHFENLVIALLRERGETLAVAESCTGGLIAQRLTSVPGASEVLLGGVVAYANEVKQSLLGVNAELLRAKGAVSEEVVRAMAEGVRDKLGADLGIATTGISGPGGGTPEKPVGLVYIAIAREGETRVRSFSLEFERSRHRMLTSHVALDGLRRLLLDLEWEVSSHGGIKKKPG